MRELQAAATPDEAAIAQTGQSLAWSTRLFDERRQSLTYACDVPAAIEQRIFALARAVQEALGAQP